MRKESKKWKLVGNKEIFDFSLSDNWLRAKGSYQNSSVGCEACGNAIKKEENWKAFQLKSGVDTVESGGKRGYRLTNPIIEFYCFSCQVEEGEKGGDDDVLPPQIKPNNDKENLIENELGENEEEKSEVSENSKKSGKELLEKIVQLQKEITTLLEEMNKKRKSLKESEDQKNVQESKKMEERISQLEKEYKQKKQKLEELEKQLNYKEETIMK